ncbi:MAG: type II toxin-antitoxin system RelE/ParE family toxin [Alphaproteobacteria bacterium]
MSLFVAQEAARNRLDEIYRYTLQNWGKEQANAYIHGLFESFGNIETETVFSRPVPAELGDSGYYFRYRKHIVYWKRFRSGKIGIVTVLHERMHLIDRLVDDFR